MDDEWGYTIIRFFFCSARFGILYQNINEAELFFFLLYFISLFYHFFNSRKERHARQGESFMARELQLDEHFHFQIFRIEFTHS